MSEEKVEQQIEQKTEKEIDSFAEYLAQPRYDVALQKPDDLCCYKDFHHTDTLLEAKEVAERKATETGRATIVYDRRDFLIVHRVPAAEQPQPEVKEENPEPSKRKRGIKRK